MIFEEALKLLRKSIPVKRPGWGFIVPAIPLPDEPILRLSDVLATDWQDASDFEIDVPAGEDT